ncbi:glycan-binding surface protein [Fibrisoma montanum]|nr:glycan-binding surface protein [Fibrisoma montanum]
MKNYKVRLLPLLAILGCLSWLSGCQQDEVNAPPVVERFRLLDPIKKDSTFTAAVPGTLLVIQGKNLNNAVNVYFNDFPAAFNPVYNTAENLIITIPAQTPTAVTAPKVSNKVRIVTTHGEGTFDFTVVQAPPVIASISNENASPGDSITIAGANFFGVSKIVFPGNLEVDSTRFRPNREGTLIRVRVPANMTQSGPLSIVATFGTTTTPAPINYVTGPGVLCNFDDVNTFAGWSGTASKDATLFPGNKGSFGYLSVKGIVGGNSEWWTSGRSINVNETQWIAPANLKAPVSDYALKFEIFVKTPWKTGTMLITPNRDAKPNSYTYRYTPWKIGTASVDFQTTGWQTVTIPLSEFRTSNGTGDAAPSLEALLGAAGKNQFQMMLVADTDGMGEVSIGVDNIRVVSNKAVK